MRRETSVDRSRTRDLYVGEATLEAGRTETFLFLGIQIEKIEKFISGVPDADELEDPGSRVGFSVRTAQLQDGPQEDARVLHRRCYWGSRGSNWPGDYQGPIFSSLQYAFRGFAGFR
ncbi:hypothetical protein KQX54_009043 [Cotesia glomerata]|uniref:Uncharacterized protein n=1 Tax=Cotesia glomerata TaxID=32391 RepID=A0AAV7IE75_COTGL|nr:hypothetical protein KQX54_009043 [Cotesia glomerata]